MKIKNPSQQVQTEIIRVLVADSNQMQSQLLVNALRRRKEFEIASCEMNMASIVEAIESRNLQVAILNLEHPRDSSPDMAIVRRLQIAHPQIPKILLLDDCDHGRVVSAFRSGARGIFCFSEHPFRLLCKCIRCVHNGEIWVNTEQIQQLIEEVSHVPSLRTVNSLGLKLLTPREEQVVALVADGLSNREAAQELSLSENTVKKYLFHIFDKLGVSSRVELVLFAVSHGEHRDAEWVAGRQQKAS
jgi:DNA-binding NarL/FixJ family response regulator